jgi:hypothetical protein
MTLLVFRLIVGSLPPRNSFVIESSELRHVLLVRQFLKPRVLLVVDLELKELEN